jgi:hypothetical protein
VEHRRNYRPLLLLLPQGTYTVTQTVNGCTSAAGSGVATPITSNVPAPTVSVTNNCNNSVLTAGSFTGTLLWSTGATTTSITVTTAGTYTVKQTVNGCASPNGSGTAGTKTNACIIKQPDCFSYQWHCLHLHSNKHCGRNDIQLDTRSSCGYQQSRFQRDRRCFRNAYEHDCFPVNVTYVYTLTANGCTNTQNVVVTVNPVTIVNCTINGTSQLANFNSYLNSGRKIYLVQ